MEEPKKLVYDSGAQPEEVFLRVSGYLDRNRLYVGIYQTEYITNVGAGHGLIRCSGNLVPFENSFPRNTKLYRLMTTKPGEA